MAGDRITMIIVSGLVVLICQLTGVWTHNKDCGLLQSNNKNVIPWMANIYEVHADGGYEFICSGTIVSQKIILTAAHCFYDDITKKIKNVSFAVSIGQKSTAWSSNTDKNIQTRKISEDNIIITKQYKGILGKYSCNIAIVKLNADQKFNFDASTSKRACIYWDNDFVESELEVNSPALKVAVWGEGKDSPFTVLEPLYINFEECHSTVAKDFQAYLTFDKMCVQIPSLPSVLTVGSGLYALNTVKNRWYLIGIASEVTSVDSKTYMTFIKMQPHLNWISNTAFLQVR